MAFTSTPTTTTNSSSTMMMTPDAAHYQHSISMDAASTLMFLPDLPEDDDENEVSRRTMPKTNLLTPPRSVLKPRPTFTYGANQEKSSDYQQCHEEKAPISLPSFQQGQQGGLPLLSPSESPSRNEFRIHKNFASPVHKAQRRRPIKLQQRRQKLNLGYRLPEVSKVALQLLPKSTCVTPPSSSSAPLMTMPPSSLMDHLFLPFSKEEDDGN